MAAIPIEAGDFRIFILGQDTVTTKLKYGHTLVAFKKFRISYPR